MRATVRPLLDDWEQSMEKVKEREMATQKAREEVLLRYGEEKESCDLQEWFQNLYKFALELHRLGEQEQKEEDQRKLQQMKDDETKVSALGERASVTREE